MIFFENFITTEQFETIKNKQQKFIGKITLQNSKKKHP